MSTDALSGEQGLNDVFAALDDYRRDCRYDAAEALVEAELARSADDPGRAARLHVARGRTLLQQYLQQEALAEFDAALALDPGSGQAARWRVDALEGMRRLDEALAEAMAWAARLPGSADVWVALGEVHAASCRWQEAIGAFQAAVEADPTEEDGHLGLAGALWDQGDREAARDCLTEAARRLPSSVEVRCLASRLAGSAGHEDEARRWLDVARSLAPQSEAVLETDVWWAECSEGQEAALRACEPLVARFPNRPEVHARYAAELMDAERWDEAVAACDKALLLEGRWVAAWHRKADALRRRGDVEQASTVARRGLELCPFSRNIRLEIVLIERLRARDEAASAMLDDALRLEPCSEWGLRLRADLLARDGRLEEALTVAEQAVALRPADPFPLMKLAGVLEWSGRCDEAVAALLRACELAPGDMDVLETVLELLRDAHRWDEATELIEAARQRNTSGAWDSFLREAAACVLFDQELHVQALAALEPPPGDRRESGFSRRLRVSALRLLDRRALAEEEARRLVADRPEDPGSHLTLALTLDAEGRTDDALAALDRALELNGWWARALTTRVGVARDAGRWAEAEAAVAEAVRHGVGQYALAEERARLWLAREEYDEALAEVNEMLRLRADAKVALDLLCVVHRNRKDWAAAEAAAHRLTDAWPRSSFGPVQLGWCYMEQERLDEAREAFEHALRREPARRASHLGLVDVLQRQRRFDAAEQCALAAVEARPDDPQVRLKAGWLYSDMSLPDQALSHARQGVALTAGSWPAVNLLIWLLRLSRLPGDAEDVATGYLRDHPDDEPRAHLVLAYCLNDQGRDEEALAAVDAGLSTHPGRLTALTLRVEILSRLERWHEAEATALDARTRHPESASPHAAMAYTLTRRHRYEDALPHLRRALQLDPEHEWACRLLVMSLAFLGRHDEAVQAAEALLSRAPDAVSVREWLIYVLREQRRLPEALAQCRRALADDPFSEGLHGEWASTLREAGSLDEAERVIDEFSRKRPHLRDPLVQLTRLHSARGDLASAVTVLEEAVRTAVSPVEIADAREGQGWIALMDNRPRDAVDHFDAALRVRPNDHDYRLGRAWTLVRLTEQSGTGPTTGEDVRRLTEAADICHAVLREDPFEERAHSCLGLIAYRRGAMAAAERHLRQAVESDPYGQCHTDLGSLYVQLGRYDEAEEKLRRAVELDWYDVQAHVELGTLALHRARAGAFAVSGGTSDDAAAGNPTVTRSRMAEAAHEFRRALAVDPDSGSAALGLAVALAEGAGDLGGAEEELRRSLDRPGVRDQPEWHLRLTLARLLVQAGDAEQSADRYREAGEEVRTAIRLAEREPEPYFVAGVVEQRLGGQTVDVRLRLLHRRRAHRFLSRCRRLDPGHQDADRALRLLEEEGRAARGSALSSSVLVTVATAVLAAAWVDFVWKHHVTAVMLTTLTPILAGLIAIGFLLPVLVRLKLPGGMEADLTASIGQISRGPKGEVALTSTRISMGSGPVGRLKL